VAKKLSKALRGKRRWIGCNCRGFQTRDQVLEYFSKLPVRLFDFENEMCIIETKLENYEHVKSQLSSGDIVSQTSSGKIKLVRERMGFSRKPRKR